MNFALDLLKGDISFFPIRHFKGFHKVKNNLDLTIIFFNVLRSWIEVITHFIKHVASDIIELNRLVNDMTNIWQLFNSFLTSQSDFCRNSMNSLDNFNHIFQCSFDGLFEFLFIGIKTHVFFLDSYIEETHFSVAISHLIEQDVHRSMRNAN